MTLSPVFQRFASKLAAVSLLAGLVWLMAGGIVLPLTSRLAEAREQIGQERQLLGRLLDEARALSARAVSPQVSPTGAAFLRGDSSAERFASLQARVEAVAAQSEVRLSSLQPTGELEQAPLRLIGLRVVATGAMEDLQRFLHELESGQPYLFVPSLEATPPAQERDPNGELEMRIVISGAVPTGRASP